MRILDLDMDYFMTRVASDVGENIIDRLDEDFYGDAVWSEAQVRAFLENNLGLSIDDPLPGRIVVGHNEALYFWKELIQQGNLTTPFEVIHVDSHADLGCGYDTEHFLRTKLLKWPPEERPNHSLHTNCFGKKCAEGIGDYLLFAIAYRWISSLTYCANPSEDANDYDINTLKGFHEEEIIDCPVVNKIQLLYNPNMEFPDLENDSRNKIERFIKNSTLEPEVPFFIIPNIDDVQYNGDFDFVVLAQSPNYTPESADFIMDVFRDYIVEI